MRKRGVKGPNGRGRKEQTSIRQAASPARQSTALAAALALLMSGLQTAEASDWYDEEYAQCRGTTAAIVQCLDRLTEAWQARLEAAYQALRARQSSPERKAALEDAQHLWADYRRANCTFYREGPGTIAAIEAAECMRVLTRQRALDLEMLTRAKER